MTELVQLQASLEEMQLLCRRLHGYVVYDYWGRGIGPGLTKDLAIQVHKIEGEVALLQRETMGKGATA